MDFSMEGIDVPTHFLCPISLQIMRDPVTISTGITYDRESIEKWLFTSKQRVCPVTKQALLDADSTPNHTLRRLIQGWCAAHGVERIPTPKPQIDRAHIRRIVSEAKKFPGSRLQCLRRLKSLVFQSERNKTYFQDAEALEFLTSMLNNDDETIVEEALEVIFKANSSKQILKQLSTHNTEQITDNLIHILKRGSFHSRSNSILLLKPILKSANPSQKTKAKDELFSELIRAINDQISPQATISALKILFYICPWGRNRIKAVKNGAVSSLVEVLNSAVGSECELAFVVLDQLCDCAEGRAEFLEHGGGLEILSRKVMRVSHLVNDKAVRIVYSICRFSATPRVLDEMVKVEIVPKLCLMVQVGASSKTKDRVKDILKLHPCVWRNSKYCIPSDLSSSHFL